MTQLAALRDQRRAARLTALRQGAAAAVAAHPDGEVWLFGSLARGDWDAYQAGDAPYWRAIGRDALRLDRP